MRALQAKNGQTQFPPGPAQACLLLGHRGAGMTALAEILRDAGHSVTGMDSSEGTWSLDRLPSNIDECFASPAVSDTDEVCRAIIQRGHTIQRLPQTIAERFEAHQQICIAGTHGKSTTSAMIAWILEQSRQPVSWFVGAQRCNDQRSGRFAPSGFAVLESCEFREAFLNFRPRVAVLTGIERDHFDCFPNAFDEDQAFAQFVKQTSPSGRVIVPASCERSLAASKNSPAAVIKVGEHIAAENVALTARGATFDCIPGGAHSKSNGRESVEVHIPLFGRHNIENALTAIAASIECGIELAQAAEALQTFPGLKRRFERRGSFGNLSLIDDYAHHPTAISATLQAARQAFPGQRLQVVFEPHQMIRTQQLFGEFASSLSKADEVAILPVFAARENASFADCCQLSGRLVRATNAAGGRAFLFANLDQIVSKADHVQKSPAVFLTLGAGRTNLIHDELNRRLQRRSAA